MGHKKIKRKPTGSPIIDPNLEEVDEERAFEIELDEESKEVVLVHHYRHAWGDEMDADVEHVLNIEEASDLIGALINGIEVLKKLKEAEKMQVLVEKKTPEPIEGNPMRGSIDNTGGG
jgi:hypothetical protein